MRKMNKWIVSAGLGLSALFGFSVFAKPTLGVMEGNWQSCFMYQGSKICTGYQLLQRGKNVCGSWSYFATGMYEGFLKAQMTTKNRASVTKICGREGSATGIECSESGDSWEQPKGDMTGLAVCQGKLFSNVDGCQGVRSKDGLNKKPLTARMKKELLAEPSVTACLAGQ